jgi:ABC-type transporter Mla maintaining outer membrane lipid asymmetry ATPase subunit MlaF
VHDVSWLVLRGPAGDEGPVGDYCLAVEGLHKSFDEGPPLFADLHLRIRRGEIVVIIGESGIGKSVFLKHLIGLEEPSEGAVWYRTPGPVGIDCPVHLFAEYDMKEIRQEIGMVFQASSLFDWMTVFENVALPLEQHLDRLDRQLERFMSYPHELFMLLGRLTRPPGPFGTFQRAMEPARATLARAFGDLREQFRNSGPEDGLAHVIAQALGADQARDAFVGPFAPDPDPARPGNGPDLATWSGESLGAILAAVGSESLPAPLDVFARDYVVARRSLRQSYAAVRARWGQSFGDLAATIVLWWLRRSGPASGGPLPELLDRVAVAGTTPADGPLAFLATTEPREVALIKVLLDWMEAHGVGLPVGSTLAPRALIRHILRSLKSRPTLLRRAVLAASTDLPPSMATMPAALAEFIEELRAIERRLAADIGTDRTRLWQGLVLAWLVGHPMTVDRAAGVHELLAQILDAFGPRPELLGRILAGSAPSPSPGAVEMFAREYDGFTKAFRGHYATLLATPRQELIDSYSELIVAGLMTSLKLDPIADRDKLPSQLSGGMKTRVGLARALAMMPAVVLYDEPTAGLDPVLSQSIAREILELQMAGVVRTSVVVTHDKDLYNTLRLAGRTRMLYLSGGVFLDASAHPVRDPLRAGERPSKPEAITAPGIRGYPPAVFIGEFEPRGTAP